MWLSVSTQPYRPLWSALEANSPFPRLEYFIKNLKNINIRLTFFGSKTLFQLQIQIAFLFQTGFAEINLCSADIPTDVESLC